MAGALIYTIGFVPLGIIWGRKWPIHSPTVSLVLLTLVWVEVAKAIGRAL